MGLQQQLSTLEYHEHPTAEQLVDFFKPMAYIRKATPREYFRLMGLTEEDIDKIDSYPCASVQEFANADKATQRQGIEKQISINWLEIRLLSMCYTQSSRICLSTIARLNRNN